MKSVICINLRELNSAVVGMSLSRIQRLVEHTVGVDVHCKYRIKKSGQGRGLQ